MSSDDLVKYLSTPKGEITIRSAKVGDASRLFDLRIEALTAHPEAFAADVEQTKASGIEAWIDQLVRDAKDQSGIIVIACTRDVFLGMSGVFREHWPKTQHGGKIWGVYVNSAWRGLRIAEAMLEECVRWAKEHGIVVLRLGVVTSNEPAIHCYERAGFKIYGTEPKSLYVDGVYYDELMMAKLI